MPAKWTPVKDGEFNEHSAQIGGSEIRVYSDRDGSTWNFSVDDDGALSLDATTLHDALKEVEREVRTL